MARLAIKGHPKRGNEVIEILEMLGGKNTHNLYGDENYTYYTIDSDKEIKCGIYVFGDEQLCHFTLEEFLEKFPYKVGDKVNYVKYNDEYPIVYTIQKMWWTGTTIEYLLDSSGFSALTKDLQPYKEETMEEKENSVVVNIEHKQLKVHSLRFDETQLVINDEYELKQKGDAYYIVRKEIQYPKTYTECCNALYRNSRHDECYEACLQGHPMQTFARLLICRDAYWKIAGEQMRLEKPWEPDYTTEDNQGIYIITTRHGSTSKNITYYWNYILTFPTEKMRDAFYENFKDLIEQCKELL